MRVFARLVKHSLDIPIERLQHSDTRHHGRAPEFDDEKQGLDRCLPLLEILLGLRKLLDIVRGIAQSHLLAPTRRQDKIVKGRSQVAAGLDRAISYLPSGMCCVLNWRSFPPIRLPHSPSRLLCFPEPLTEFV